MGHIFNYILLFIFRHTSIENFLRQSEKMCYTKNIETVIFRLFFLRQEKEISTKRKRRNKVIIFLK
ncbi:MAG TPA: hypothetical protein DD451_04060 [Candidatus Moranbacteria bacterium]|nr:hypothetical protein [Candidatus Moranbacteria bacterium]